MATLAGVFGEQREGAADFAVGRLGVVAVLPHPVTAAATVPATNVAWAQVSSLWTRLISNQLPIIEVIMLAATTVGHLCRHGAARLQPRWSFRHS